MMRNFLFLSRPLSATQWLARSLFLCLLMFTGMVQPVRAADPNNVFSYFNTLTGKGDASSDSPGFSPKEVLKTMIELGETQTDNFIQAIEASISSSLMGRPTAIIVGNEIKGAAYVGYRKGAGKLVFKGDSPQKAKDVYWVAPSAGLTGGIAINTVLMMLYNADVTNKVFSQFYALDGSYHLLVGGSVSVMRNSYVYPDPNAVSITVVSVGFGYSGGIEVQSLEISPVEHWVPNLPFLQK